MMTWCLWQLQRLTLDRRAVSSIEYALMAAMIALVIINGLSGVAKHIVLTFGKISSEL